MFIIGDEVYEDDEIFSIDPYYNNPIDYYNIEYDFEDELDIIGLRI
jgi:hypothetical protein